MNVRAVIRRSLEVIFVGGGALSCSVGARFASLFADSTPLVRGDIELNQMPVLTEKVLAMKDAIPVLGLVVGVIVVAAAIILFVVSSNEDTRLQGTLVISGTAFCAALQLWILLAIALVVLPSYAIGA